MFKGLRIVLVSKHPLTREGLRRILVSRPSVEVVAEADDLQTALKQATQLLPDVIILGADSIEAVEVTRKLREACGSCVLAIGSEGLASKAALRELLRAGATGYVSLSSTADELFAAVAAVAAGEIYIDSRTMESLISGMTGTSTDRAMPELAMREIEVARRLALGYTNKAISVELGLSIKTIETYKTRAMKKLKARSRVDLIRFAAQHGWLDAV